MKVDEGKVGRFSQSIYENMRSVIRKKAMKEGWTQELGIATDQAIINLASTVVCGWEQNNTEDALNKFMEAVAFVVEQRVKGVTNE